MGKINIAGQKLIELIESKPFRAQLNRAVGLTDDLHDSGFTTYYDSTEDRFRWSPIFVEAEDDVRTTLGFNYYEHTYAQRYVEVLDVRLTQFDSAKLLMEQHYCGALEDPEFEGRNRPILAAGATKQNGDGYLVLVQRTYEGSVGDKPAALRFLRSTIEDSLMSKPPEVLAKELVVRDYTRTSVVRYRASGEPGNDVLISDCSAIASMRYEFESNVS